MTKLVIYPIYRRRWLFWKKLAVIAWRAGEDDWRHGFVRSPGCIVGKRIVIEDFVAPSIGVVNCDTEKVVAEFDTTRVGRLL